MALNSASSWYRDFFYYFQVSAIQEEANRLQGSYAGDKAKEIQAKEDEVVDAWKRLNWRVKQRTERLHDADDLYRFLLAVQDQMLWMNDMLKQILTYEKAKWVSLLYHSRLRKWRNWRRNAARNCFWDGFWGRADQPFASFSPGSFNSPRKLSSVSS